MNIVAVILSYDIGHGIIARFLQKASALEECKLRLIAGVCGGPGQEWGWETRRRKASDWGPLNMGIVHGLFDQGRLITYKFQKRPGGGRTAWEARPSELCLRGRVRAGRCGSGAC